MGAFAARLKVMPCYKALARIHQLRIRAKKSPADRILETQFALPNPILTSHLTGWDFIGLLLVLPRRQIMVTRFVPVA